MSRSKPVSIPFIVEWEKIIPEGDRNVKVYGSYTFYAFGHDYSSVMSYAFTRAVKACKVKRVTLKDVQMKGEYDPKTDSVLLWKPRRIITFPDYADDFSTMKFSKLRPSFN